MSTEKMSDLYDSFLDVEPGSGQRRHRNNDNQDDTDDDDTSEPAQEHDSTTAHDDEEESPAAQHDASDSHNTNSEQEEEDASLQNENSDHVDETEDSELRNSQENIDDDDDDDNQSYEDDHAEENGLDGQAIYDDLDESEGASLFNDETSQGASIFNDDQVMEYDQDGIKVFGQSDGHDHNGDDYHDRGMVEDDEQKAQHAAAVQRQKTIYYYAMTVCVLICLVVGTVLGAVLTQNDTSIREGLGIPARDDNNADACEDRGIIPEVPTFPIPETYECPQDNEALEIRIVFDAAPGDIGIHVIDPIGIRMWDFPPGSFGSFALLLRENIFTLCLGRFQNYTLELIDAGGNGLISSLGVPIFGSFQLVYANQLVTTYHGDCRESNVTECGNFCKCSYFLAVNASTGACVTECE